MTSRYTLKGINSDTDTCEICGKTGLAKVMWIAKVNTDGSEDYPIATGTTCGAKKLGIDTSGGIAKTETKITEMQYQIVKDEIKRIYNAHTVSYQQNRIPREFANAVFNGQMTMAEAITRRNEMYPIIEFMSGRITIEEAMKFI